MKMKKVTCLIVLVILIAVWAVASLAQPRADKPQNADSVFVGDISESLCGFKHPMADAKKCTLGCVKGFDGTTFVLADQEHQKMYNLSSQRKAKAFAGEKVEVRGTFSGDTIRGHSIRLAH